ncbi:MAG: FG-GAP-like repeat-containing protein [Pyrinomonadaceae bacterium]
MSGQVNVDSKAVFRALAVLFFCCALGATSIHAVDSPLDGGFNVTVSQSSNYQLQTVLQPDGKILVFGNFDVLNGHATGGVARLNADGTFDSSFSCGVCSGLGFPSVYASSSGQIYLAGATTPSSQSRIYRLNSDGSNDSSFQGAFNGEASSGSTAMYILGENALGELLVVRSFAAPFVSQRTVYKLASNGSLDGTFNPISYNYRSSDRLNDIIFLADGGFIVAGANPSVRKYDVNGNIDASLESPTLTGSTFPPNSVMILNIEMQSDGKLVIAGSFETVNGVARPNFARLNPIGSVDIGFNPATSVNSGILKAVSGDKMITANGTRIIRLNSDGTTDKTYSSPAEYVVQSATVDQSERVLLFASNPGSPGSGLKLLRLLNDGSKDSGFSDAIGGVKGSVTKLELQSDQKVLIGGVFENINGVQRNKIGRVNSDGSIDMTFDPGLGVEGSINDFAVQADGKILVAGQFTSYDGAPVTHLFRLAPDGSLDTGFAPEAIGNTGNSVFSVVVRPDGKILVGGNFFTIGTESRTGLALLNSDGSLDSSFNVLVGSPNVYDVAILGDGKLLFGGSFSGVNGFNRTNIARLNSDGTLDSAFNASVGGAVVRIAETVGGYYVASSGIKKLNPDGSINMGFSVPLTNGVSDFAVEDDGNIVLVGSFASSETFPRNHIARVNSSGELDGLFLRTGLDASATTLIKQADGKIITGGSFEFFEGTVRIGIARFSTSAFTRIVDFDFDGDGKADVSVFRPSENKWYILRSSDFGVTQSIFALSGDRPIPADYDGDGLSDLAIYRVSLGDWWYLGSQSGSQIFAHLGASTDIPVPSDFDGDGRADYVVYRPSTFQWYRISSINRNLTQIGFGGPGDKPVAGDFNGDGKSDIAIYRPSDGNWWWKSSADGVERATKWGLAEDIPTPGDYDGDGKTDFAVYRPSNHVWYILNSSDGSPLFYQFGLSDDVPVPADYDGDGKTDVAQYRPSNGVWYLLRSRDGFTGFQFGIATDIALPAAQRQ